MIILLTTARAAPQRKRKHSLRTIINDIFSLNNGGVQWRNLDSKYPPWQTVFYYFSQLKQRGIWENILDVVVVNERKRQGKGDTPCLLAIDSQSVKKMQFIKEETGIDGGKNINAAMELAEKEPYWLIQLGFRGQ